MHDDIQYICLKKYIYAFWLTHPTTARVSACVFFACLGSKLFEILEQNSNQKSNCKQTKMATTKVKSNQGWPSSMVFEGFLGDHKSHQPGNKKCVAPASSTKFD